MGQIREPAGVLVIRAWVEDAPADAPAGTLRARIVQIRDLADERTETVAAGTDAVIEAVRVWLEALLATADAGRAGTDDQP